MENLEHLIGAYFHQDWDLLHSTREEAVADFVRRSPERAVAAPREFDELLDATPDDGALADRLSAMGFDDAPPDGDRAFLLDLRAHLCALLVESRCLDAMRALLASTQRDEITLGDFEQRFLQLHADMPLNMRESSAEAIEELFWTVEAFVAEPSLRAESEPDERALLEAITTCLSRLEP